MHCGNACVLMCIFTCIFMLGQPIPQKGACSFLFKMQHSTMHGNRLLWLVVHCNTCLFARHIGVSLTIHGTAAHQQEQMRLCAAAIYTMLHMCPHYTDGNQELFIFPVKSFHVFIFLTQGSFSDISGVRPDP